MEEGAPIAAVPVPSKSLQELAIEGQRALEAMVEAAHETLASMNEVLCNAALWSTSSASTTATPASSSSGAGTQSSGTPLAAAGDPLETTASRVDASKAGTDGSSQQEAGWGALDDARLRLRSSATSLKAVIATVFSSPQTREHEDLSASLSDELDPMEVENLEQRVIVLRKEVKNKNKVVKLLIDQLRELVSDISMWQSPGL